MTKKLKINEANQDQYTQTSGVATVLKTKDKSDKKADDLEIKITELHNRIDTQYKLLDKLVRDVKRIKDQISVIAGKLPRG
jgi:flagellin-like hook-associated protein FlgL